MHASERENETFPIENYALCSKSMSQNITTGSLPHDSISSLPLSLFQVSKKSKDRKFTMTPEDLSLALADQGITLKKPPYYM